MRKKDRKKGWYIYYWTFQDNQVKHLFFKIKQQRLDKLKERLKREQSGQFYICDERCMRLNFEQAMDFEFKCPECGHLIELQDNAEQVKRIKKEIAELEKFFLVAVGGYEPSIKETINAMKNFVKGIHGKVIGEYSAVADKREEIKKNEKVIKELEDIGKKLK